MLEMYIGLGVAVIVVMFTAIYLEFHKKQQLNLIKEKLEKIGTIEETKSKAYNFILTVNDKNVYIKFLSVGRTKELSINSRAHWQVDSRRKEVNLLKTGGFERLKPPKVLIVSPKPERIIKFINENEAVFVKYDELCFDFHLFTIDEVDKVAELF